MPFTAAGLTLAALLAVQAPPAATVPLTRDAYVLELGRLRNAIQTLDERAPAMANPIRVALSSTWRVVVDDGVIEIDPSALRDRLAQWQQRPRPAIREELMQTLQLYADEAMSADNGVAHPNARAELDRILSAREFAQVRGPSAFDQFRQRLLLWLSDLLSRVAGASAIPSLTRWMIGLLVAVALGAALFWMYRSLRSAQSPNALHLNHGVVRELRAWPVLLADARAAAERGDWRDAVHLAYWTAIEFLESNGAWRPDPSRTPREYVRLIPASDTAHAPLAEITRIFEHVWYAAATADADRFSRALAALESLGCRLR
ncbi:MAG: DUF4129 domain-containing protein [Vicinamibacterales bacterium]